MKKIMITVLMAMYNTPEKELRSAIESILNQTYPHFEFLIINDGCTDNSVSIVNSYHDKRIRLIHNHTNLGLEKSLNIGLALAKYEYIARMDTDDISFPNRLKKQISYMRVTNNKYAVVSSRVYQLDEDGIFGLSHLVGEISKSQLIWGMPFHHPTMLYQKKIIQKIGGYPEIKRHEDYAMIMELYIQGFKGYIIDEPLLQYRTDFKHYQKMKKRLRLIEIKIKWFYFRKLKVKWWSYFLILKPILLIFIPNQFLKYYQKKKFQKEIKGYQHENNN